MKKVNEKLRKRDRALNAVKHGAKRALGMFLSAVLKYRSNTDFKEE